MQITRHVAAGAAVLFAALALAGPSFGFAPGDDPNQTAVDHCLAAIARQDGLEAGGGPKAGHGGPTNCDHYWQYTGVIGAGS